MGRQLTREEVIEDFEKVHGKGTYDYSKFVYVNTHTKGIIICHKHGEFKQTAKEHKKGNGCPNCSKNKKLDTEEFIEKAKETHEGDYEYDKVKYLNTSTKVEIYCKKCKKYFWQTPGDHLQGRGCPDCRGNKKLTQEEVIKRFKEVHGDRYDYSKFIYKGADNKSIIICKEHGEFKQSYYNHYKRKCGCLDCAGNKKLTLEEVISNCKDKYNKEYEKYDYSAITEYINSDKSLKIYCNDCKEYFYPSYNKHYNQKGGCPLCNPNTGWTIDKIKHFVRSIRDHIPTLSPKELYTLIQKSGMGDITGKGKAFVKSFQTGRFPVEEIDKMLDDKPSAFDDFVDGKFDSLEEYDNNNDNENEEIDSNTTLEELQQLDDENNINNLPVVNTHEILKTSEFLVKSSSDEEDIKFFIESGKFKLWSKVFNEGDKIVQEVEKYKTDNNDSYSTNVKKGFLDEYYQAKELQLPKGYSFSKVKGEITQPNIMQRLIACKVKNDKRVGNWSGTGSGKTLSAVLASRVIDSKVTVICCPNSIVKGWKDAILEIFPDSKIHTKAWETKVDLKEHNYLIFNYEMFQQSNSAIKVKRFVESLKANIDFIIIDEIHYAKQRNEKQMSARRSNVNLLTSYVTELNKDLCVLGMSATPVINNIQEGKSLLELITTTEYSDQETKATVENCITLHKNLMNIGFRYLPQYDIEYNEKRIEIDCSEYYDELKALGKKSTFLDLEKILTQARLPEILNNIKPKTLIYTHLIDGIDILLKDAIEEAGWSVGFYTGDDKTGLDNFINGDLDVLIGTSAIGTGVDGLQTVCNNLIVNISPWTHAEFEQLRGRIFRQGQVDKKVDLVIPVTYIDINDEKWSWCKSKLNRIHYKKTIADTSVDGNIPEHNLPSMEEAYKSAMEWLRRLESGGVETIERRKITVPLPVDNEEEVEKRLRKYGDFSKMNRLWNTSLSSTNHKRLQDNPEEWENYHTLYQEARKTWSVIPYKEIINWLKEREGYKVGDFGCGEAIIAEELKNIHEVHSFDHIAINDNVTECDMVNVPIEDNFFDVAIFSLSLMGCNLNNYISEARRTLKIDGKLYIIEATSRFKDIDNFCKNLEKAGFGVETPKEKGKFTFIIANKKSSKFFKDFILKF